MGKNNLSIRGEERERTRDTPEGGLEREQLSLPLTEKGRSTCMPGRRETKKELPNTKKRGYLRKCSELRAQKREPIPKKDLGKDRADIPIRLVRKV